MLELIFEAWYKGHLNQSWIDSFKEQEEAQKNKDKSFDRNWWFKLRISEPRWCIYVPDFGIKPSSIQRENEILKEFYKEINK